MPKSKRPIVVRPKPKRAPNGTSATPIGMRQRELDEAQEKLQATRQRLESLIEEAPNARKRQEEIRQNAILKERARGSRRLDVSTLLDNRFDTGVPSAAPRTRKALKAERRQDRITFFGLLLLFLLLTFWVWNMWR